MVVPTVDGTGLATSSSIRAAETRSQLAGLVSVGARGEAELPAEEAGEMVFVEESTFVGNLLERRIRAAQACGSLL